LEASNKEQEEEEVDEQVELTSVFTWKLNQTFLFIFRLVLKIQQIDFFYILQIF